MRRSTSRLLFVALTGGFLGLVSTAVVFLGHPAWRDTPVLQVLAPNPALAANLKDVGVTRDDVERAPWQAGLRLHGALLAQALRSQSGSFVEMGSGWRAQESSMPTLGSRLAELEGFELQLSCRGGTPAQQLAWLSWSKDVEARNWVATPRPVEPPRLDADRVLVYSADGAVRSTYARHARPWWVPSRLSVATGDEVSSALTEQLKAWAVACAPSLEAAALATASLNRWDKMPPTGFMPVRPEYRGRQVTVLEGQNVLAKVAGATRWQLVRTDTGGTALRWHFDELEPAQKGWQQLRSDLDVVDAPAEVHWRRLGNGWESRSARWLAPKTPEAALELRLSAADQGWVLDVTWSEPLVRAAVER